MKTEVQLLILIEYRRNKNRLFHKTVFSHSIVRTQFCYGQGMSSANIFHSFFLLFCLLLSGRFSMGTYCTITLPLHRPQLIFHDCQQNDS